ncbi:hypothetical protein [Actinoallomurus sp. NPDC052274]|uniref:hypothetical protein n=1 Tax=Actinoallomurus sp. NPDC052274 TaxID=3155420 RepID=UPI00342D55BC
MPPPDPLETTVPDPVMRRRPRLSPGRRRMVEAGAFAVLATAYLVAEWTDHVHQASSTWTRPEKVSVVRFGTPGVLGRAEWRMLGQDGAASAKSRLAPPGAVHLTLLLQVHPLDAQGVKDAKGAAFQVRDPQGHIWTAYGDVGGGKDPAVGSVTRVTVTTDVPAKAASTVLLEVRANAPAGGRKTGPIRILRFAH